MQTERCPGSRQPAEDRKTAYMGVCSVCHKQVPRWMEVKTFMYVDEHNKGEAD